MSRTISLDPIDRESSQVQILSDRLFDLASSFGINLEIPQLKDLVLHLLYMEQINEYINLTAIRSVDDALVLHVLDSILYQLIAPGESKRFLDMGTGGGYPGVPFGIINRSACGILLDSVSKKVNAVNSILHVLDINRLIAVHDRLETYATIHAQSFDVVLARALAPLSVLLEYARPYLPVGGCVLFSKGIPQQDELDHATSVASMLGFELESSRTVELPDSVGSRNLYRYRVIHDSSIRLPRSLGFASKKPL